MKMMKQNKVICLLAIVGSGFLTGCSTRVGPPASVHYDKTVSPYHIVKKGDSIASIALKYGMSRRELIRINGLESPYRIVKGQRLVIRARVKDAGEEDETELPAIEDIGNVPEEDGIKVRRLDSLKSDSENLADDRKVRADQDYADSDRGEAAGFSRNQLMSGDSLETKPGNSNTGPNVAQPARLPEPPPAASTYILPVRGKLIRAYNHSGVGKAKNSGINITAPRGTPVVAANNGVVAHSGNQVRGFGNVVLVKHDNGTMTVYAHLDKVSVTNGQVVSAGEKLGTVGKTGTVTQPQLHFEIRQGSKPVDPTPYLPHIDPLIISRM
jgi:lipoprotein NlpD